MSDRKYEVLPPMHRDITHGRPAPVSVPTPSFDSGDFITAFFDRLQSNRDRLGAEAENGKFGALTALTQTKTGLVREQTVFEEALVNLYERREVMQNNVQYNRFERQERLRDQAHTHHIAQMKRDVDVERLMTVCIDARQQRESQEKYGHTRYEIGWRREQYAMLELDWDIEAKKQLLRETNGKGATNTEIDHLYDIAEQWRQELLRNNLNTSHIDDVLAKRKR